MYMGIWICCIVEWISETRIINCDCKVLLIIIFLLFYSWSVPSTATTGTVTTMYSQVVASGTTRSGGGGGVLSSRMNAGEHAITKQPQGNHTHRQPHGKDEYRGW